jgi:hypothetical protein
MTTQYDDNKAGVCWITFKEGISDEKIQEVINKVFQENEDVILGMEFNQLTTRKRMIQGKKAFDKTIE